MNDTTTTLFDIKERVTRYVNERDWSKFHTPKNAAMSISCEAAELLELFVWAENSSDPDVLVKKRQAIEDEAADVLTTLVDFCRVCNIDLAGAFERKMEQNDKKYPIDKVRGRAVKHTDLV